MDTKQKILVFGAVRGNFRQLFNRLESINKKNGPFELVLCTGDFFGPESNDELQAYTNGNKTIAVPTYILGSNSMATNSLYSNIPESGELCPNLTYLGKRGLFSVSSGLKIAYLSGIEGKKGSGQDHMFDETDVRAVRSSCLASKTSAGEYRGIDILVTSQWPAGIENNGTKDQTGSKLISWLAREIRPRYHFCGLADFYYERVPYRNTFNATTSIEIATRFIALAWVNNVKKAKYLYALSVCPIDKMRLLELIQKTTNETDSPYQLLDLLKTTNNEKAGVVQFFYDTNKPEKRKSGGKHHHEVKKKVFDQEKCWFCLSSPSVEKHLVITVGEHFYLALAKGPVNQTHCLLLPITHVQCSALLSSESWNELHRFKQALISMFKDANQVTSFFERNYRSSHLQINVIAVDANLEGHIKKAFVETADKFDITLEELPPLLDASDLPDHGPYFVAELPNQTALLTRQMKMFPLNFGREPFCAVEILDCPEKIEWKDCELKYDQEVALVMKLRAQLKQYNFTA